MSILNRAAIAVLALATLAGAWVPLTHAAGKTQRGPVCPAGTVCDRALGVAVTLQKGWVRLHPPAVPLHEIDLVRASDGPGYDVRLVIRSLGATADSNAFRAAQAAATRLIQAEGVHDVTRTPVHFGGAAGVLMRGLPASPSPAADIVLAHNGGTYLVIAPGKVIAADQENALATLQFIGRVGPFPIADPRAPMTAASSRTLPVSLWITPRPVILGHPLTVFLSGVQPGMTIAFALRPDGKAGFGGGLMGRYRAGKAGTIRFTYGPFRYGWETGVWRVTATRPYGQVIASTSVRVTPR